MSKPPGYHYFESEDGQLAVEMDVPCPKFATLTWIPKTYGGARIDGAIIPRSLLDYVMISCVKEIAGMDRHAAAAAKAIRKQLSADGLAEDC